MKREQVIVAKCEGVTEADVERFVARLIADHRRLGCNFSMQLNPGSSLAWERRFFPCCESASYWVVVHSDRRPVKHELPPCPQCDLMESRCSSEQGRRQFAREIVASMQAPLLVALDEAGLAGKGVSFGLREIGAQLRALESMLHNGDGDPPPGQLPLTLEYDPDRRRYIAGVELGEYSGGVEATTLEHLLRALPFLSEDTQVVEVGPDGVIVCPECSGEGCTDCEHYRAIGPVGQSVLGRSVP